MISAYPEGAGGSQQYLAPTIEDTAPDNRAEENDTGVSGSIPGDPRLSSTSCLSEAVPSEAACILHGALGVGNSSLNRSFKSSITGPYDHETMHAPTPPPHTHSTSVVADTHPSRPPTHPHPPFLRCLAGKPKPTKKMPKNMFILDLLV